MKEVEENSLKFGKTLNMGLKDIKEMEQQTKDDLFNQIKKIFGVDNHAKKSSKEKWLMSQQNNEWTETKWKNMHYHSFCSYMKYELLKKLIVLFI